MTTNSAREGNRLVVAANVCTSNVSNYDQYTSYNQRPVHTSPPPNVYPSPQPSYMNSLFVYTAPPPTVYPSPSPPPGVYQTPSPS